MDFIKWFFLSATKEERNNLLVLPTFFLLLFLAIIVCVTLKNYKSKNIGLFFSNIKKIIENTRTIKKILLCYFFIPTIFRSIIPVTNQDQDYIIKVKWDKREPVEATKLELLCYYFLVCLCNMLLIIIVAMICNQVCSNDTNVFLVTCSFWISIAITQQFGAGYLFRARINSEAPFFVFNVMLNFSIYTIVSLLLAKAIGRDFNNTIIYWLDKLGIVYVIVVVLFQPIFNLVILPILQLLKRWKRSNLKEKPGLIVNISLSVAYVSSIVPITTNIIMSRFFSKVYILPTYNLTIGYSQYLAVLIGGVTCLGIFLALFDNDFFGKNLSHYIFSISKNKLMITGVVGIVSSFIISFFMVPLWRYLYYKNPSSGGRIAITNTIHIYSILAIALLLISTGILVAYFYQVTYLFKNYTGKEKEKKMEKLVYCFREIIADDVQNCDLKLDFFAQNHLIKELINKEILSEQDIVELFNTKFEFRDLKNKNTVVLAVLRFICNSENNIEISQSGFNQEGKLNREILENLLYFYATDLKETTI